MSRANFIRCQGWSASMARAGVLLLLLAGAALAGEQRVTLDFSDPAAREAVTLTGKAVFEPEKGRVLLRGPGSVFLKEPTGTGNYRVDFALFEPKGFTYHANAIRFLVPELTGAGAGGDRGGYALQWSRGGLFNLSPGQQFIEPGRDNPHRFAAGERVGLALTVSGDRVTLGKVAAGGEPICAFRLAETPGEGYFGVRNRKAGSEVAVYRLEYAPPQAGSENARR